MLNNKRLIIPKYVSDTQLYATDPNNKIAKTRIVRTILPQHTNICINLFEEKIICLEVDDPNYQAIYRFQMTTGRNIKRKENNGGETKLTRRSCSLDTHR